MINPKEETTLKRLLYNKGMRYCDVAQILGISEERFIDRMAGRTKFSRAEIYMITHELHFSELETLLIEEEHGYGRV